MTNLRRALTRRGAFHRPALYLSGVLVLLIGAALIVGPRLRTAPAGPGSPATAAPQTGGGPAEGGQAVKIYTVEEGMYAVGAAELRKAGFDLERANPAQLVLLYRGREQPFWVEGDGQARQVRFYAQAADSLYSTQNVYWLAQRSAGLEALASGSTPDEPGSPQAPETPPALPDGAYFETVRVEQNLAYNPQVEAGDHFLWLSLPAPKSQDFEVEIDGLLEWEARLTLEVWASTEGAAAPDHHLVVRANGQAAADEAWDGKGRHTVMAKLPAGLLKAGTNVITVEAPGDTGVAADITFVDWIEIEYARKLAAVEDRLEFTSPGGQHGLEGFSGAIQVFDVSDPQAAAKIEAEGAAFEGQAGRRYIAVGPDGYRRAARVEPPALDLDLRAAEADYIAIGPPDLLAAAQPLLDWREKSGLRTLAAPLQSVYDQFGWGMPEPEAIRLFLQYAAQQGQPAPKYLLLLGDASYDPKGYLSTPEVNRLPTFLTPTVFGGETASDVLFTQLDEDSLPDLAVGRLPARIPEQVSDYIAKLLAYEQDTPPQEWRGRVLAVADGQEASFSSDAQAFLDLFSGKYTTELLSPQAGASGANEQILGRLAQGDLIVGYFGHGSINMWGKDKLFTNEDAARLENEDRLPVVINMTCLTGLFTHPKMESLAEALLWRPQGGAAAVLAATSLTLPTDQGFLSRALAEALLAGKDAPLGDALLEARRSVSWDTEGARDVLETFLLFGDPALRMALK